MLLVTRRAVGGEKTENKEHGGGKAMKAAEGGKAGRGITVTSLVRRGLVTYYARAGLQCCNVDAWVRNAAKRRRFKGRQWGRGRGDRNESLRDSGSRIRGSDKGSGRAEGWSLWPPFRVRHLETRRLSLSARPGLAPLQQCNARAGLRRQM